MAPMPATIDFAEFTESAYVKLLDLARAHVRFEPFGTTSEVPHVLWRHDIDMSVHRAYRLAHMEAERNVRATYFVLLHSPFYSALERPVVDRLRSIARLGHFMGLHFEVEIYDGIESTSSLAANLQREKTWLEDLLGVGVNAVSFHNPGIGRSQEYDADSYAGMTNAQGRRLRRDYIYLSDSNGYWRFQQPTEVILKAPTRLHLLTHPEWWTPSAMSPRARVRRCIRGRSRNAGTYYDELLLREGRCNVR
jgi:hypothetical protein